MQDNRILVNPDGQVFPCCYLGNPHYFGTEKQGQLNLERERADVMKQYDDNKNLYNINTTNMADIISSEWFTKTLPESWEDETQTIRTCKEWCGKKNEKSRI